MASFANLSGLRQSIERHREEALAGGGQRAGNPARSGLVGRVLAQVLQDSAEDDGGHTEGQPARHSGSAVDRLSVTSSDSGSSMEDFELEESALLKPDTAELGMQAGSDDGHIVDGQAQQELRRSQQDDGPPKSPAARRTAVSIDLAALQEEHHGNSGGTAGKTQGSISFADGFGGARAGSRSAQSPKAWAQDESSVSFGPNLTCEETLAGTPSVACGPRVDPRTEWQAAVVGAEAAARIVPTPAPSSIGSVQMLPSSRHSLGPADAIRSISLNPSPPPGERPSGNRDAFWARASVSFRQAHGLAQPLAFASSNNTSSAGDTALLHGAREEQEPEQAVDGQLSTAGVLEDDADIVVYDSATQASGDSPPLSINLQRIFDESFAQVSPLASSCQDPGHVMSLVEQELLDMARSGPINTGTAAPNPSTETLNAPVAETGMRTWEGRSEGQSASAQQSSHQGLRSASSRQMAVSTSHVLLRENPLSAGGSFGSGEGEDSEGVGSTLLAWDAPRRSLEDELALAASLGPGIRQREPLNPFPAQQDQGHLMSPSTGGQTGNTHAMLS